MAGHSKWANIKHRKGRQDAARGKLWSKIARAIIVAAKNGGGDPETNLTLRYAIDEARDANMPKDTIKNAIKKGTGELESENYEEVTYEGYGPAGVAFMVPCLTDNRNRTAPEMRKIFEKCNGQLGGTNCVAYMFEPRGKIVIEACKMDEDSLMELAIEAGADDVVAEGDFYEITCAPAALGEVKGALADKEVETVSAEVALVAANTISPDLDAARKVLKLTEALEDHDDVQKVYSNFDIPDELLAELEQD